MAMDYLELLQRLSVAFAVGMLIGIERGWGARAEAEGERAAGLRTFALIGLLGGVMGALSLLLTGGAVILAISFAATAAMVAFFRSREMLHEKTFGATTVVASMLAFALGALAAAGQPAVAAAAGVAATGLLALKAALHGWLRELTWEELRAGLMLLAMTLILLPLLPDRDMGPFGALNPHELWLMAILIAGVSFAGYVAIKWIGGAHGVVFSGIAGGLVSSTAVTLSYSQLALRQPERTSILTAGALLASVTMVLRILLVAGTINFALMRWLLLPLGLAAMAMLAVAGWLMWQQPDEGLEKPLLLKNPFELGTVLKFTAFLAAVMVASKAVTAWSGDLGAYALAAISGIADVDALTLSMARLGAHGLGLDVAAGAILIAAAVNTVSKTVMGWVAGGRAPGLRLAAGAAAAIAAGALGVGASHAFDPVALMGISGNTP